MIQTMKLLHKVEVIAILFLLIISAIEGFFLVKISQKEPSTALVVVEDTTNLTELPEIPEINITEK